MLYDGCLVVIQNIILKYLSYSDIVKSNLESYMNENEWKLRIVKDFSHVITDQNFHGSHYNFQSYYKYVYNIEYGRATIWNFSDEYLKVYPDVDSEIYFEKYYQLNKFTRYLIQISINCFPKGITIQDLYPHNINNTFIKEINILKNIMDKMTHGDIIIVDLFHKLYLDEVENQKTLIKTFSGIGQPLKYQIIIDFSLRYWDINDVSYINLTLSELLVKYVNINLLQISTCKNIKQLIIFTHENISYAIISYNSRDILLYPNYNIILVVPTKIYDQSISNFLLLKHISPSRTMIYDPH